MRIALGGPQGGVSQHLLNLTQISPAVQHLGGSRMAQGMRGDVGNLGPVGGIMDHLSYLTLTYPATAHTKKEGLVVMNHPYPTGTFNQPWPPPVKPSIQGTFGGKSLGHAPLLAPLAQDLDGPRPGVQVDQVQPAQLGNPHPGRI